MLAPMLMSCLHQHDAIKQFPELKEIKKLEKKSENNQNF